MYVFAALLNLSALASAWSINGHLYVANIAENLLAENAPSSLDAANEMFHYLCDYDAEYCTHEDMHAFVECATFADDFKYHGEGW